MYFDEVNIRIYHYTYPTTTLHTPPPPPPKIKRKKKHVNRGGVEVNVMLLWFITTIQRH